VNIVELHTNTRRKVQKRQSSQIVGKYMNSLHSEDHTLIIAVSRIAKTILRVWSIIQINQNILFITYHFAINNSVSVFLICDVPFS